MPTRIRTASMSSSGDRFTRQVWLLALNCLAACLLPLPGAEAGVPPKGVPAPPVEATPEVPVAIVVTVPVVWTVGDGVPAVATPEPRVGPEHPDAERLRAEHFCALYGCVSLGE